MALTKISTGGVKDDAASQAKIADEAVDEARLQISNAGTNGQFLSKSANTGGLTWATPPDNNTVYTHPNHSGEVTSTGDGATVIADNIVDEANLKVSNTPTNGQFLSAQSGASGGLTWSDVTIPPSGNTLDLVADGAIAAGKPVILTTAGKAKQVAISTNPVEFVEYSNIVNGGFGYSSSSAMDGNSAKIAFDPITKKYLVVYEKDNGDLVSQVGVESSSNNRGITWGSETVIHSSANFSQIDMIYTGNSRFLVVYRHGNGGYTIVRIGKMTSSGFSWSGNMQVDGFGGSSNFPIYNENVLVKLTDDRVACICIANNGNCKWSQSKPGVLIGDITSDTAWTYRSFTQLDTDNHDGQYNGGSYDSTNGILFTSWATASSGGRCNALKVAAGTSATITKGSSNVAIDSSFSRHSSAYHSGQNKFIVVYNDGSNIDSKIATVNSTSLAVTLATGPSFASAPIRGLALTVTPENYIYMTFAPSNRYMYTSISSDFNGSTFSWNTSGGAEYRNVASVYNGHWMFFDQIFVTDQGSGKNWMVIFGESYSNQPTYFTLKTEAESTNFTGQNFLGFAPSAIGDTNTGTINLGGNVVGNQSGLTILTRYYVQNDGTLGTNQHSYYGGGMAIAADKIIINPPQKEMY